MKDRVFVFDTTLRDGSQMESITLSVQDKMEIINKLDDFGVDFIEGGMPCSNPTDKELFTSGIKSKAKLVAFGSTCKPGIDAEKDECMKMLASCDAKWICLFGKAWKFHVKDVLHIDYEENLKIIRNSIEFLKKSGKNVIFDAEHYFDGFCDDSDYAISVVKTAKEAGADWVTLCDTNGGNLPSKIGQIVEWTIAEVNIPIGIHCHNDSDLAVACTLEAVESGARMVQVTVNGIGERCGNANLCSVVPDLVLKMGYETSADLTKLTSLSYAVSDICNIGANPSMPYVGSRSFTHKGGMHIDALLKDSYTYEHISPDSVGNRRNIVISEQSGKAGITDRMKELGLETTPENVSSILNSIKKLESEGYQFDAADASLELLMRRKCNDIEAPFSISSFRIYIEEDGTDNIKSEASIKILDKENNSEHTASDGNGPVDAMNNALIKALSKFFPVVEKIRLTDYKVRVLDEKAATAAPVRVMIRSTDGQKLWTTVGVSTNVIEASLIALLDSMEYAILKDNRKEA